MYMVCVCCSTNPCGSIGSCVYCVSVCVLQYMVVYQCIVAQASMAAFFVDGSSLDNLQVLLNDMTYTHDMSQQTKIKRKPSIASNTSALLVCVYQPVSTRIQALLVWVQDVSKVLKAPKAPDLHTAVLLSVLRVDSSAVPLREVVRNQAALDFTCKLPPGFASQGLSSSTLLCQEHTAQPDCSPAV